MSNQLQAAADVVTVMKCEPLLPQVMYVGVTYTGNGPYRSEVPAVSSRSLDSNSLFQVRNTKSFLHHSQLLLLDTDLIPVRTFEYIQYNTYT